MKPKDRESIEKKLEEAKTERYLKCKARLSAKLFSEMTKAFIENYDKLKLSE